MSFDSVLQAFEEGKPAPYISIAAIRFTPERCPNGPFLHRAADFQMRKMLSFLP